MIFQDDRKVTKFKGNFPMDEALLNILNDGNIEIDDLDTDPDFILTDGDMD